MPPSYLGLAPTDILARLARVASTAAGLAVSARVGGEIFGCCNVGVDFPRVRRPAAEARALRRRVCEALERDGVVLAESALAPRVGGDLRGSVRVREEAPTRADAAHMITPPRSG